MNATTDTAMHDPLGQSAPLDFDRDGVTESPFGMDKGGMGGLGSGTIRDQTTRLKDQASEKLWSFADNGKQQVTSSLDGLVQAAREIADKLQDGQFGPVGGYATAAADTLERWSTSVRDKSVEDLIDDSRDLVRSQPAVAVGVAIVAGFVLSRFLKAGGGTTV